MSFLGICNIYLKLGFLSFPIVGNFCNNALRRLAAQIWVPDFGSKLIFPKSTFNFQFMTNKFIEVLQGIGTFGAVLLHQTYKGGVSGRLKLPPRRLS